MKKPNSKKPKIFEKENPNPGSLKFGPTLKEDLIGKDGNVAIPAGYPLAILQRDPGDETNAYDLFVSKVLELLSEHDQNQPDLHPSGGK